MIDFNNLSRRRLLQAMALAPLMFAFPALSASRIRQKVIPTSTVSLLSSGCLSNC